MSREQSDDEDSVGGTGIIRFGPPNGAKPKWLRHGLPLPRSPEPGGQLPGAGVQPVGSGDGHRRPQRSYSAYPGRGRVSVGHRWVRVAMDILDMSVATSKGNRYVLVILWPVRFRIKRHWLMHFFQLLVRTLLMLLPCLWGEHRDNWDDLLPAVMMAYRFSVHESTGPSIPY